MAYQKKADRTPAEQQVQDNTPTATAYSLVRAEGGYWSFIKWDITQDGTAKVAEVSVADLFPITLDKIERAFLAEVNK